MTTRPRNRRLAAAPRKRLAAARARRGLRAPAAPASPELLLEFDGASRYVDAWADDEVLLARPRARMVGRTINEVLGAEHGQYFTDLVLRVFATGRAESFAYALVIRGVRRQFLARAVRVPAETAGGEPTVIVHARDVTEYRRAQEQIARYQVLLERAGDMVVVARQADGRVIDANAAAVRAYRYPRHELLARALLELWPARGAERAAAAARLRDPRVLRAGVAFETVHRRRDGTLIPVELSAQGTAGDDGPVLVCIIHDITERRRAEAARAERERLASLAADVGTALARGGTLDAALARCAEALVARLGAVRARVWTLEPDDGGVLVLRASAGAGATARGRAARIALGACVVGRIARTRRPVYTAQATADPRFAEARWIARARATTFAGYPLVIEGRAVGVMALFARGELSPEVRGALASVAQSLAVGIERARAEQALRAQNARLSALSRRLLEVQEQERRHLARELHDEIGQVLTGLKFTLESTVARMPAPEGDGATAAARLRQAQQMVSRLIGYIRALSLELRPTMLDDLGLLPALLAHLERTGAQTGLRVRFDHEGIADRRFAPAVETAAYRIVQEALTNVARHAGVTAATLRVRARGARLRIEVRDRGAGFDAAAALRAGRTSGLAGMRERAVLLGGRLAIDAAPGAGCALTAELPLAAAPPPAATPAPAEEVSRAPRRPRGPTARRA